MKGNVVAVSIKRKLRVEWRKGPRVYRYQASCMLSAYGAWTVRGFTKRGTADRLNRVTARILAEG